MGIWFGGKRRVASLVWSRFGNVATYNEPFFGSGAVLLARPHPPRVETINDLDAGVANFWRALQADPDAVAYHADGPVNECDLHARHRWLVARINKIRERLMTDPEFYDVQVAGWWVWGQCLWIGSGWCQRPEWTGRVNAGRRARGVNVEHAGVHSRKRFASVGNGQGTGVHSLRAQNLDQKRPKLYDHGGTGVHRRWQGGGQGGGSGVHAPNLTRQMPRIATEGGSISGVTASTLWQQRPKLHGDGDETGLARHRSDGLYFYLEQLAARLRRVRVCCGDWRRVLTPSVTTYVGLCGIFLDPPYSHELRERCYSEDHDISADVRVWALEHGDDPHMRIALCGYDGEHEMPDTWECVKWKAHGGYSRSARGVANRDRERIWFSKYCLRPQDGLFSSLDEQDRSGGQIDGLPA